MHHDYIYIALGKYYVSALRLFSQIHGKKIAALVEHERFGAVHVFWFTVAEYSAGKADNIAPNIDDREHESSSECVVKSAGLALAHEPRFKKLLVTVAQLVHRISKAVPGVGRCAQAESGRRLRRYLPCVHIRLRRSALGGFEAGVEKSRRITVQVEHPAPAFALGAVFLLGDGHPDTLCQKFYRFGKAEVFYLHYEIYHAAALAAAEAVVDLPVR